MGSVGLKRLIGRHQSRRFHPVETVQGLVRGAPLGQSSVHGSGHRNIQHVRGQVFRVRLVQVIVALRVICQTVVPTHVDLSRGDARYLEATFLLHLGPGHLGQGLLVVGGHRRGRPSLGRVVVAATPGGGGRGRAAAPPPEVEGCFPAPARVSRKVLVVHGGGRRVGKRGRLFPQLPLANAGASWPSTAILKSHK